MLNDWLTVAAGLGGVAFTGWLLSRVITLGCVASTLSDHEQ